MILLLRPVDTFFFRNHKSFVSGEDSTAGFIFPPRLGTIYGALRSAYIHKKSDFLTFKQGKDPDLKYWMGTADSPGVLKIKGAFLYAGGEAILPLAMDYQVIKEKNGSEEEDYAYPLVLKHDVNSYSSAGEKWSLYGTQEEKSSSSAGAYIPLKDWKESLFNRGKVRTYLSSQWVLTEDKLGIARDWQTTTSKKGMLYQMQIFRFKDEKSPGSGSGFVVFCEDAPDFSEVKYLRLGGKNRPWTVEVLKNDENILNKDEEEKIIKQIEDNGIARMMLLTPTIWNGEQSDFYLEQGRALRIRGKLKFTILAEAMGRPELIGGWDIARNRPKKRMLAVPAGSVFYLEVKKGQARELLQSLKEIRISDELAHEGYGWAVCSAYNEGGR